MSYEAERVDYKGFTIRLVNDESPEEPDWGDDEFFLINLSARYTFGRGASKAPDPEQYLPWGVGRWGEYGAEIPAKEWDKDLPEEDKWEKKEARGLYEEWLYEHDTGYEVWPFRSGDAHGPGTWCIWVMDLEDLDRQVPDGWIFVKVHETPMEQLAAAAGPSPEVIRDALIEDYQKWGNGDVWGYIIEDEDGDDMEESCWGFYGTEECLAEAQGKVDYMVRKTKKIMLLLLRDSPSLSWETQTLEVPLWLADSKVPAWAMRKVFGPDPGITGAALISAFAPVPERTPLEQLAVGGRVNLITHNKDS